MYNNVKQKAFKAICMCWHDIYKCMLSAFKIVLLNMMRDDAATC